MKGLTIYDYLLLPIYLYAISYIFKKLKVKYKQEKHLLLYFTLGFRVKIICIIVYTLLINFVLRGDSVDLYFGEAQNFATIITNDPSQVSLLFTNGSDEIDKLASDDEKGYLRMESNYMVVKVAIVLCFLTFSKLLLINLIMGFIAFLGSWQLFRFFYSIYPSLHKEFAIAILAVPNVIFWSSGISKDTICMASLGFMVKALYDIVKGGNTHLLRNLAISFLGAYLIFSVKSYILFCFLPFFILFLISYIINRTSNVLYRIALKLLILLSFTITLLVFISSSQDLLQEFASQKILDNVTSTQSSFARQAQVAEGSFFSLGEIDGSISGFIKMAPKAMFASLFRPFIWESNNFVMFASAVENMAILLFTLITLFTKAGILNFFRRLFTDPLVTFCIGFALLFAIMVGITTSNFGSLVRYKIPCIPFFLCGLIIIWRRPAKPIKQLKTVPATLT